LDSEAAARSTSSTFSTASSATRPKGNLDLPRPIWLYFGPVTGPIDVVSNGITGVLHENLRTAALAALTLDPAACRKHALGYTWQAATHQFLGHLAV